MSYTRLLRSSLLVGLAAVFFIPFVIADGGSGFSNSGLSNLYIPFFGMFFPFITGKNFVFRIIVEIVCALYVLLALREPKYRPRASHVMWVLGAFVLWIGVSTIFSVDPVKSFWSNLERMEGYVTMLHLFVYFTIVGAVVAAEEWWDKLFKVSIASSVLMGLYAVLQLSHIFPISSQSGTRVDGTFGNAIYLAVFMLCNLFLTLFMLVRRRHTPTNQALYGVALVLQFAGLFFTETRGALLGFIGGLIIAALYIVWKGRSAEVRPLRRIAMWGLGILAILIVAFVALRSTPFLQHSSTLGRLASISLNDTTTRARLFYIWPIALKGATESPRAMIVGHGEENFNFVFNKYYVPQMYNQEQWFDRAHNQFLDWLIAGGIPAFLLYVALFGVMVWIIMGSALSVPEQAILLGLLGAYAFNNLTVFDDIMSSIYFMLVLAFVHSLTKKNPPRWMFMTRPANDQALAIAAPIVAIAAVFVIWVTNAPAMARAENLLTALTTQVAIPNGQGGFTAQQKDAKTILANYQTALGAGVWPGTELGRQEVTEQLLQYASGLASSNSVDPAVKQDTASAAQNAITSLMQQRPHDARLELFNGAFLDSFGQYPQAIEILKQALADSPNKQQIMFEMGVSYLNAGQNAQALPILKAAFDEEPDFADARILYASGLYYTGDKADADALLTAGFGSVLVDDSRLMQVYVNTKQYDRVVGIWKLRVQKDPGNVQYVLGLAAAYFTAGDKTNAIAQLERAAQLDPALNSQIQAVITQIKNGTLKTQ